MVQSKIAIRDVVAEDLKLIYQWENNPENWEVSETTKPFTFEEIKALIDSSSDFSKTQQKRWDDHFDGNKRTYWYDRYISR